VELITSLTDKRLGFSDASNGYEGILHESLKAVIAERDALHTDLDTANARVKELEGRDKEAVKIIMAAVGNGLLDDPIFSKLLARAQAFYDNAAPTPRGG